MHQEGSLFWQNFAWAGHFLGRSYCLQVANMSMFPLTANVPIKRLTFPLTANVPIKRLTFPLTAYVPINR